MKISVMGCGWLGFPLAQQLLIDGHEVMGSTRSEEKYQLLKKNGITPFRISIPEDFPECQSSRFWRSETLFLNIPPERGKNNGKNSYSQKIEAVRDVLESSDSEIGRVIFASSTSVYPSSEGYYTEDDTEPGNCSRPSGESILEAETILQNSEAFDTTILRFGGLYGYERHPVHYMAGRTGISGPYKPVNLIHQDDCIRIVRTLLKQEVRSGVYNAVSDGHPPRKTLYQSAARHFGVTPPQFDSESESINRVISNKKLKEELEFTFTYPNPLDHTG